MGYILRVPAVAGIAAYSTWAVCLWLHQRTSKYSVMSSERKRGVDAACAAGSTGARVALRGGEVEVAVMEGKVRRLAFWYIRHMAKHGGGCLFSCA